VKVGSLFTGIGGLDLGLERAGMEVIWQAEVDPYCCKVLKKHWPDVANLGDVTKVDWSDVERPDLVCGGYPCQPFSYAGRRNGADDPRHLWPHFARCLRVLRPGWALLENVPGHLGLGFDGVLADLAALGFDAEWELLPAAAVGAPHLRYRLFVVAHAQRQGPQGHRPERRLGESGGEIETGGGGDVADADGQRFDAGDVADAEVDAERTGLRPEGPGGLRWRRPGDGGGPVGDAPGLGRGQGPGIFGRLGPAGSGWWFVEPDVGRVAHGVPHRVDRLRALGNAVVPQVAEWVGSMILEAAS